MSDGTLARDPCVSGRTRPSELRAPATGLRVALAVVLVGVAASIVTSAVAWAQDTPASSGELTGEPTSEPTSEPEAEPDVGNTDGEAVVGTIATREVLVDHGETLPGIAQRELGSSERAAALADFNRLPLDTELQAGMALRIPVHVPAVSDFAVIVFVKGEVSLNDAPAAREEQVVLGDVLRTGANGFAALRFTSGATVNLQPDTELTVSRLACLRDADRCTVELGTDRGGLGFDVDLPDSQPANIRVNTPFASAAVRGTRFRFATDPDVMRVTVTEGRVLTESIGSRVWLVPGFGSVTRAGEPPGEPQALLSAPVFRNVPPRSSREDRVRWWPLAEIDSYRATLSSDSAGVRTLAEQDVAEATLSVGDLSPGELYLTVRAIDEDGLEGQVSNTRLVVAAIDTALPAPAVSIERQGESFLVSVEEPPADAAGFEIQLSTDPAFDDPLGADVGPIGQAVFRLDMDVVYARARQLDTPLSVSAYGATAEAR